MKKNILKVVLGLVCITALVLAGAENADGSLNAGWSLTCLAIAGITGFACQSLFEKKEDPRNV